MTDKAFQDATSYSRNANILLLWLLGIAVLVALTVSVALSNQIVKPIHLLTEKVQSMQGDKLDFHWDLDTDDETQMLANSFESLTQRMRAYVRENESITAERERIWRQKSRPPCSRISSRRIPTARSLIFSH